MKFATALFFIYLSLNSVAQTDSLPKKDVQQSQNLKSMAQREQYDFNFSKILATKKKHSTALLISGSVLIGTSPFVLIGGGLIVYSNAYNGGPPYVFGVILGAFSFIELAVGISVLVEGIIIRCDWLRLSKEMKLYTGFLPSGRMGLALNF